jgi:NAD(P)-dependent dehydrogenase (short-subunit alcohol dehydrogenase family)
MAITRGKRIVITGANSGIGFETARQLAADGSEIIMICRNRERGTAAMTRIRKELPDASLALFTADMASPASIRQLAAELHQQYDHLGILINNAGGMFYDAMTTDDGLEYTFGLNHMGYFRLTSALLPLLEAGRPSRIINVSSEAHRTAKLNFTDLQNQKKKYRAFSVYSQSKLANLLFTRELAKRTEEKGIETAALHPGFVNTNFGSLTDSRFSTKAFKALANTFGISPEQGAATTVHLAQTEKLTNGAYYAKSTLRTPSKAARDEEAASRLWEISESLA